MKRVRITYEVPEIVAHVLKPLLDIWSDDRFPGFDADTGAFVVLAGMTFTKGEATGTSGGGIGGGWGPSGINDENLSDEEAGDRAAECAIAAGQLQHQLRGIELRILETIAKRSGMSAAKASRLLTRGIGIGLKGATEGVSASSRGGDGDPDTTVAKFFARLERRQKREGGGA